MEETFNLIDDPWLLVRNRQEEVEEVSIRTLFEHASEYTSLAGETEAQNFAVLRVLIAILLAVIYRSDPEFQNLEEWEIFKKWKEMWDEGSLNMDAMNAYLDEHHDQFWLYGPEQRFMQSPYAQGGTYCTAAKLLGVCSESANKVRLFQPRSGEPKEVLTPSEAARWLINLNFYDDTAVKKSKSYKDMAKKLEKEGTKLDSDSPGAGWGGKIGPVYIQGSSLFETLMLNCILLKNGSEPWESAVPYWEKQQSPEEEPGTALERRRIPVPEDLAALLTLPSRRIWLDVDSDGKVSGYSLVSGDFFERTNADTEQFTFWRLADPKKKDTEHFIPKRHTAGRQIWRDLKSVFGELDQNDQAEKKVPVKTPGIIQWLEALEAEELLPPEQIIQVKTPFVRYGDKDFMIIDLSSSSMKIYASLASKAGENWVINAQREVNNVDKAALAVRNLARNIELASGSSDDRANHQGDLAQEKFYQQLDQPFLNWVSELNPSDSSDPQEMIEKWRSQVKRAAFGLLNELTAGVRPSSLLGKTITEKKKTFHISVPEAEGIFLTQLYRVYPKPAKNHSDQQNAMTGQDQQEVNT